MLQKIGTLDEAEDAFASGLVVLNDFRSGDIAGHQVGGELHALEGQIETLRERGDNQGFCEAGDAFQQAVAFGEDGDQDFFEDLVLANDHGRHFGAQSVVRGLERFDRFKIGHFGIAGGGADWSG